MNLCKKFILRREISVVSYQGRYERKRTKIDIALNATIMLKLVKHKWTCIGAKDAQQLEMIS